MSLNQVEATDKATEALEKLISPLESTAYSISFLQTSIEISVEQSKISGGQIRDNLALLTTTVREAVAQAKENSASSSNLAKSLNRITLALVVVGIIQVLVTVVLASHR
jgi:hypothetical protein